MKSSESRNTFPVTLFFLALRNNLWVKMEGIAFGEDVLSPQVQKGTLCGGARGAGLWYKPLTWPGALWYYTKALVEGVKSHQF
jgi:hypothetical protein